MTDNVDDDKELQDLKRKVAEMQREAEILQNMQEPEKKAGANKGDKKEADGRSVYVGNVDYGSTPEELQEHFNSCGTINRITILCDKYTGHPKG
jgi:polyadenylate-binding protein 2